MLKCFLVLIFASLAACRAMPSDSYDSTADSRPTPEATTGWATPESTMEIHRVEFQISQMHVSMDAPVGWQMRQIDDQSVMIAEHLGTMAGGNMREGIRLHVFLPEMDEFTVPEAGHANIALSILDQAMAMPKYLGDSQASEPVGFSWGGYEAAYYLVASPSGSRTMVLAVMAPPDARRLLVCNLSAPVEQESRIRPMTLLLLGQLTVNGVALDSTPLDNLPDPLIFLGDS
jgi:hypothetical protein